MSGALEAYVQLPPDGAGKLVDAVTVMTAQGLTVYRQTVTIGDNEWSQWTADVDEQSRLQVHARDSGLLDMIAEDIAQADGAGPGLLKPPNTQADGTEPSIVVQISPNSPLILDQSVPAMIGGVGPDGVNRRARVGTDGGLQQSDAVGQTFTANQSGTVFVIDTSGYQSINLQLTGTWAGTATFWCSNDQEAWTLTAANSSAAPASTLATAVTTTGQYMLACYARYFRVTFTFTSGLLVAIPYLRSAPLSGFTQTGVNGTPPSNMSQVAGATTVTANLAGLLAIGGGVTPGAASTAWPVVGGGADSLGFVRKFETDQNGALITGGILSPGYQVGAYNVTYSAYTSVAATLSAFQSTILPTLVGGTDQSGAARRMLTDNSGALAMTAAPASPASQSITDLLSQILGMLRVQAQYLYEIRSEYTGLATADEPDALLADYTNPLTAFTNSIN